MDDSQRKEDEEGLETGRGTRQATPQAPEGGEKGLLGGEEEKGTASWSDIVHSVGLTDKPVKPGLLTKEGDSDGESEV